MLLPNLTNLNPIIPGSAPDPSVALVGDTYYLVVSTFHLFPRLPIFRSRDLVTWQHPPDSIEFEALVDPTQTTRYARHRTTIGHGGGLYAPTIRYHGGTCYVVCTNGVHGDDFRLENFIVQTQDILSNNRSDPVYFKFHGIDPSLFWDGDGRAYVQGSAWGDTTTITCMEIDVQTSQILTLEKTIWESFSKIIPEGPHLYKKDGWYCLLVAECGTSEGHSIVASRSRHLWGPYESCPNNPLLEAAPARRHIQHTGHGDLFQDPQGNWWMVCLGVRENEGRYVMGRETFLTPVTWNEDGCPTFKNLSVDPDLRLASNPIIDLVYIRDPAPQAVRLSSDGRDIVIFPLRADLTDPQGPIAFVGKRLRSIEGCASVALTIPDSHDFPKTMTGISFYKDEHRFVRLYWSTASCSITFEVLNRAKKYHTFNPETFDTILGSKIGIFFSCDTSEQRLAREIDSLDMTGYDFVGPVVGIFAVGSNPSEAGIDFKGFVVQ
nr:hypothetical protein [Paramyrothecium sp.]